jgi:hypothetical protein
MSDESGIEFFEGDLVFNGIDGETGEYILPPMPSEKLARLIKGQPTPRDRKELLGAGPPDELTEKERQQASEDDEVRLQELGFKETMKDYPVIPGVDPARLDQSGWAVVFPAAMDAGRRKAIKGALKPLLDLRREQAGEKLYRVYEGAAGYQPGERKDQFFKHQDPEINEGPANPTRMPFYVLLVGSPEEIPYDFQFQLDVMRGVGRIDFGDDLDAYNRYAQSVVMAERGEVKLPRRASFFGAANPGDKATQLSAKWLVEPLVENLLQTEVDPYISLVNPWQVDTFVGKGQATKDQLGRLLGGDPGQTPALLFTASHGMGFKLDHRHQLDHQGALLCQEWGGPGSSIKRDHYFAGVPEDLADDANVLGMIALFFACYGAGTPRWDHFAKQAFKARSEIAPHSFTAALPNRLLSQGALAVIGHVERAWGYSFVMPGGKPDRDAFITTLRQLANGDPVGLATDLSFNARYAAKATNFSSALQREEWEPGSTNPYDLAYLWTSNNDARNYVVVGDPAARVPAADVAPDQAERPVIEVSYRPPEPAAAVDSGAEPAAVETADAERAAPTGVQFAPAPAAGPNAYTVSGTINLQPAGAPAAAAAGPTPSYAAPAGVATPAGAEQFGIFGIGEGDSEIRDKVVEAVQNFIARMGEAMDEAATLEVRTYTIDDLSNVDEDDIDSARSLRAWTRVKVLGDIEVYVPSKGGEVDQALWALHSEMVEQAQANRAEMIRTALDTVSGLVKVI